MLTRFTRHALIGLCFALLLVLLTFSMAAAGGSQTASDPAPEPAQLDCKICHKAFYEAWALSAHGQAATDPTFRERWEAEGRPSTCLGCHTTGFDPATGMWQADGILCAACHGPYPEKHPKEPMPTDRSARFCGTCHTETHFEWQVSKHRAVELACVGCHDPHSNALRAESPSALCSTCHQERASNFAHTVHAQQGLSCADCHLGSTNSELGEGHALRDHSFNVRLSTCNQCHAYQMHAVVQAPAEAEATPAVAQELAASDQVRLMTEPGGPSLVGFAAVAGLVGMATGMILAPWLERWYRRLQEEEL